MRCAKCLYFLTDLPRTQQQAQLLHIVEDATSSSYVHSLTTADNVETQLAILYSPHLSVHRLSILSDYDDPEIAQLLAIA
jgi:hypothetical protein